MFSILIILKVVPAISDSSAYTSTPQLKPNEPIVLCHWLTLPGLDGALTVSTLLLNLGIQNTATPLRTADNKTRRREETT